MTLEIVGGFFLGSLVNDLIVRGFVFAQLKDKLSIPRIFVLSVFLYSMEDIWMEGFSLGNTIFSVVLGLSLTYAFMYTGSIWANTGLHWGLNVCYGMFNGMVGDGGGGIFIIENGTNTIASELTGYIIPLLMFFFVWKFRAIFCESLTADEPPEVKKALTS
nr:CPBP family intramembrane glutamic endopeptidase [Bacillus ectoiniformans]